jgi:hypothetical protein
VLSCRYYCESQCQFWTLWLTRRREASVDPAGWRVIKNSHTKRYSWNCVNSVYFEKMKEKLFLCLGKYLTMKTFGRVDALTPCILNSGRYEAGSSLWASLNTIPYSNHSLLAIPTDRSQLLFIDTMHSKKFKFLQSVCCNLQNKFSSILS